MSDEQKPKETKEEYFERRASKQIELVVRAIDMLGRCSKRPQYVYTDDQVVDMFRALHDKLDDTIELFERPKAKEKVEPYKFCFGKGGKESDDRMPLNDDDDDDALQFPDDGDDQPPG